jgi:hypothetical protein
MPSHNFSPYEFGCVMGLRTKKQASWGEAAQGAAGAVIGGNPLDPTQRGIALDIAAYSNPISGVPTAALDTAQHLWNGRFGSALGSIGMGALSFLPGVGGAIGKGIAKGVRGVGKVVGSPALARGGAAARQFVVAGGKNVNQAQGAITNTLQKVIPQKTTAMTWRAPVRSTVDAAIRNPAMTATIGGSMLDPTPAAPMASPTGANATTLPHTPALKPAL